MTAALAAQIADETIAFWETTGVGCDEAFGALGGRNGMRVVQSICRGADLPPRIGSFRPLGSLLGGDGSRLPRPAALDEPQSPAAMLGVTAKENT